MTWLIGHWSQADQWFFDEAERRRRTARELARLRPPPEPAERHEAVLSATAG